MNSALQPVSDAVYTLLQADQTLVGIVGGGIWDVVPENPGYPFVWYEVGRPIDARGFGAGSLPQLDVRTHTYTVGGSMLEAFAINNRIIMALADQLLPIDPTAWKPAGLILSEAEVVLPDEQLRGIPVHEVVAMFRLYVESLINAPLGPEEWVAEGWR